MTETRAPQHPASSTDPHASAAEGAREGAYDEALLRFHATGPERQGWLSNHGPMVIEALSRRGAERHVHSWSDGYISRLDERPRGIRPIDSEAWRDPLGDPVRSGDWIEFMLRAVAEEPWRHVLVTWWPRLLPGIAAGATHGVIRVGHAVQALRAADTEPRRHELAHALAYWAARWQPTPSLAPAGQLDRASALATVPRIASQRHGIRSRLAQLPHTPGWGDAVAAVRAPHDPADPLAEMHAISDAAIAAYPRWAHGNATMLVHAATAPAAVARALPALPQHLALASIDAAWAATCAVVACYRPASDAPREGLKTTETADEAWARAVAHGGEHVIKFADVAVDSQRRTGEANRSAATTASTAVATAIELDA